MDKQLKDAFKRAADIAGVVPESMHEAAFNRALDALMGVTHPGQSPTTPKSSRQAERARAHPTRIEGIAVDHVAALSAMERSKAPEVDAAEGAQAKALALLLVAHRELDIDGLTSQQIASVLTDKFRHRVTRQAISQAMDAAGSRVDRVKEGRGSRYRIMEAGERWLEEPGNGSEQGRSRRAPTRRRRAKGKKPTNAQPSGGEVSSRAPNLAPKAGKKPPGRRPSQGPKAAVESLIAGGWFATPRGLGDIRKELEHGLALRFSLQDLSPSMTRLLREGRLQRAKTEAGQYEYTAGKS